ncbi:tetratricopeptide repeat protein [Paracoccus spongiarum]|uniref:Tetratricopeptide repeat protein n=1 Tax=Paracoccus spongiarum TaxID=3064387 RepID=A0ABT9J9R3_9RHOB|nr:tetratricopeptide repeat protein [Paracoccus sp. 2205BS29-5]MDP5305897.1 tetratricopeptide repeat protein [Paracoccus sp. 2205BS29-5]
MKLTGPTSRGPNLALIVALLLSPVLAGAQGRPEPRPAGHGDAPVAEAAAGTATEAVTRPAAPPFGLAGPYLAARMAAVENDFLAAARYFTQAVAHDPGDPYLEDSALVALVSAGQVERAVTLANEMKARGGATELALLVHRADLVHRGDWQALLDLDDAAAPATDGAPRDDLMAGMIRAWALLGAGRASDALAAFEALAANRDVAPLVNYHLALARALVGDFEGAEALLADEATGTHMPGFVARAQVLAVLERRDEAVAMLDALPGLEAEPQMQALRDRLAGDEPVTFDAITNPADGIAQVFLTFATALASSPDPEPLSLIHARLAAWLSPEMGDARLMVAQLLQDRQQFDLAEPEFEALRSMGQMRPVAELARIDALSGAERRDEAEKAALALTAAYPALPQAWIALGDLLRQQEKFAQAVPAYDKALSLLKDARAEARWFPLYARGIALERSGQFERAEQDLLAAIEIKPDQASLLNYLGYSWIDRNVNLDRALEMIRKAVDLSPGDGYILDSLAWAYYRLGRFDEAVAPMEQAIGSMSADPLVNDHLGDIYWMVGRTREAEIQWQRALSLGPGEGGDVDPARIRAKLERGLDAVLADEAAGTAAAPVQPRAQTEAGAASGGSD